MSRAISLIVATLVLFLFYGFDIDSKIQQSAERIAELQSAMTDLDQQQVTKEAHKEYAKEIDHYNLMISKFPGHLFAAMRGYQPKPMLSASHKTEQESATSAAGVDFNNLTIPSSTPAQ